jgi:tetratricopeptide (TPR) repeat protein
VLSARGEIGGRQLKAAVTAAIGSPARRRPEIGSVLAFDLGGAPMTISVTPLREKDQALLASEPLALVLMSYDNRPSIDRTALRAAYDLTDAEARLAIALPLATSASRNGDVVGKAWLYTILVNLGRSREALGVLHSMRGNDATFAEVSQLILQRRYAPALEHVEAELARTENPMWIMCAVELATKLGRNDVALKYVEKGAPDLLTVRPVIARLDVPMALSAAQALARLGNHKQAERIIMSTLSGALSTDHYVIPSDYVWRSAAYALLGQRNRALLEFEEAYRQGYRLLIHRDNFMAVEDYPMFETIRTDSRFRGVLARIAQANLHASAERSS